MSQHQSSSAVEIDCDNDMYQCNENPPLLSHSVLCLEKSCGVSCLSKLVQFYEQLRWKITANTFVLHTFTLPILKNKFIPVIDILILFCFIIFEIISFSIELHEKELSNATDIKDSFRIFGLVCGHQSVIIYSLTWTLATRNTFWYFLIGIPFERALFYHVWFGRYAVFLIYAHFSCLLFYWNDTAMINENLSISTNVSGLIAFICCSFLFVCSLSFFRRNHWEFFLKTHWVFLLGFFYFGMKHDSHFWFDSYWMKIAIFCWLFDVLYRCYISLLAPLIFPNCHLKVLAVELLSDDIIKLTLQKNTFRAVEGQYCFVCIPAINITEWHPFSISNYYTNAKNQVIVEFHIKVLGDWTKKLKQLTDLNHNSQMIVNWNSLTVFMEGPYGKTKLPMEKYNSIVFVAGGIGITPIQNMFNHLIEYIQNNNITTIKRIHFLWMIRNPELTTMEEFNAIHWQSVAQIDNKHTFFQQDIVIKQTKIKTNYFVTRVTDNNKINKFTNLYGDGISFHRPKMDDVITTAKSFGKCAIFACGPMPMICDVKKKSVQQKIDCHTETFFF